MLSFDQLQKMNAQDLHEVMLQGHPLDMEGLADTRYQGVDLSLPAIGHALLWKTFRKTFHRDPSTGLIRGWNVRLEQHGVDAVSIPLRDRRGRPRTFGHYVVAPSGGTSFPRGWRGAHHLDYGAAGNRWSDLARFTFSPLVAVNPGDMSLLLGWEVLRLGSRLIALPDYWALRYEGALRDEDVVAVPVR